MKIEVNQEEAFKVLKSTFTVSKTSGGYTLQWCTFNSQNDEDWQSDETPVPADESLICNGITPFVFVRLYGNTDEGVVVIL